MTPERFVNKARLAGVRDPEMFARTRPDKFGGAWVVVAAWGGVEYLVTQTPSVYVACHWMRLAQRRFAEYADAN